MARLHRYKPNSSNSGYFLKGWTKHSGNTTLQVRYPCELLLDWMGFEPGDKIPSDLITSLFEANLLFTIGDGTSIEDEQHWAPSLDSISKELESNQRQQLLGFVREYDGPRQKFIDQLRSEIDTGEEIPDDARLSSYTSSEGNWHVCIDSTSRGADESLHQIANKIFGVGSLTEESSSILKKWEPDADLESFSKAPHVESSVRLFNTYVGEIHSVEMAGESIVYVASLPERTKEDPWPKFVINHYPGADDFELIFRIYIPDKDAEKVIGKDEIIVHDIIVLDDDLVYWSIHFYENNYDPSGSPRDEFEEYLQSIFESTVRLMEYLTGETVGESLNDVVIEFEKYNDRDIMSDR
jgi:hypothetical protein